MSKNPVTELLVIDREHPEDALEGIERGGRILREGGLVAFPTETVYGLGGDALNPHAAQKIYAAKGRPSDNPLIVHIADLKDLDRIVTAIPPGAKKLAEAFWPGPLTMIFPKSPFVPTETSGGLSTVAVRMPSDEIALKLIRAAGGYVAAPSANTSGRPSPTSAEHVLEDLEGKVDMIIDGGEVTIGLESTIVDFTEEVPVILRPGFINQDMLTEILGEVKIDPGILDVNSGSKIRPKAPGMRYRHYAPQCELTVVEGSAERVVPMINALSSQHRAEGRKVGVIASAETASFYRADLVREIGSLTREEEIGTNLFSILRSFDHEEVEVAYSESFDTPRMGMAIMNRLLKAAGYRTIDADRESSD